MHVNDLYHHLHYFRVDSLVLHYVYFWQPVAYAILFLGMILEGEIFLFTGAFLASQGYLGAGVTFLILFVGVEIGDSLWYLLGHSIKKSDTRFARWLISKTGKFDDHLLENPKRTIFISKFFIGLHHFILARAGVLKVRYKEFFKDDLIANICWIIAVGGLGYLSGASFNILKHYIKFAEYSLIIGLVVFLALDYLAVMRIKKKL